MAEGAGSIYTGGGSSQPLDLPVDTALEVPADWSPAAGGGSGQGVCSYSPSTENPFAQSSSAWPPPASQWQGNPRDVFGTPPPSPSDQITNPSIPLSSVGQNPAGDSWTSSTGDLDAWFASDQSERLYSAQSYRAGAIAGPNDAVLILSGEDRQTVLRPGDRVQILMENAGDTALLRIGDRAFEIIKWWDGYYVIDVANSRSYLGATGAGPFSIGAEWEYGAVLRYQGPEFIEPAGASAGRSAIELLPPAPASTSVSSACPSPDAEVTGVIERPSPGLSSVGDAATIEVGPDGYVWDVTNDLVFEGFFGRPIDAEAAIPNDPTFVPRQWEWFLGYGKRHVEVAPGEWALEGSDGIWLIDRLYDRIPYGFFANDGTGIEFDPHPGVVHGPAYNPLDPSYSPDMGELVAGEYEILCGADALPRGYAMGEEGYDLNRGLHPEIYEQPVRGAQPVTYFEDEIPVDVAEPQRAPSSEPVANNCGAGNGEIIAFDESILEGPRNAGTFEQPFSPGQAREAAARLWERVSSGARSVFDAVVRPMGSFVTQTLVFVGLGELEHRFGLDSIPAFSNALHAANFYPAHIPAYMIETGADFATAAFSRESLMRMWEGGGRFFAALPAVTAAMDSIGLTPQRIGPTAYGLGAVAGTMAADRALVVGGEKAVELLIRRAGIAAAEGAAEEAAGYMAAAQAARWTVTRGIPLLGTALVAWDIGSSIPDFANWAVVGLSEALGIADAQSFDWDMNLMSRFCQDHWQFYPRCNSRSAMEDIMTPIGATAEISKIQFRFGNGAAIFNEYRREMASEVRQGMENYRAGITALLYQKAMFDIEERLQQSSLHVTPETLMAEVQQEVSRAFAPPALLDGTYCNGIDDDCDNSDGIDWGEQEEIADYAEFKESLKQGVSLAALRAQYADDPQMFDNHFSRVMGEMLEVVGNTDVPYEGWTFGDEFEQKVAAEDSHAVARLMGSDIQATFEQQNLASFAYLIRHSHNEGGELIVNTSSMSRQEVARAESLGLIYDSGNGQYAINKDSPTSHVYEAIIAAEVAEMPEDQRQAFLARLS